MRENCVVPSHGCTRISAIVNAPMASAKSLDVAKVASCMIERTQGAICDLGATQRLIQDAPCVGEAS